MLIKKMNIELKTRQDIVIIVTKAFDCYHNERWHVDFEPQFNNYFFHTLFDINYAHKTEEEVDNFLKIFISNPDKYIKLFEIQAKIIKTVNTLDYLYSEKKKYKEYGWNDFCSDFFIDYCKICDDIDKYVKNTYRYCEICNKFLHKNIKPQLTLDDLLNLKFLQQSFSYIEDIRNYLILIVSRDTTDEIMSDEQSDNVIDDNVSEVSLAETIIDDNVSEISLAETIIDSTTNEFESKSQEIVDQSYGIETNIDDNENMEDIFENLEGDYDLTQSMNDLNI